MVADRGINFPIPNGLQFSRVDGRWFEHNHFRSLEDVLLSVENERRTLLTRRFVKDIFEIGGPRCHG